MIYNYPFHSPTCNSADRQTRTVTLTLEVSHTDLYTISAFVRDLSFWHPNFASEYLTCALLHIPLINQLVIVSAHLGVSIGPRSVSLSLNGIQLLLTCEALIRIELILLDYKASFLPLK